MNIDYYNQFVAINLATDKAFFFFLFFLIRKMLISFLFLCEKIYYKYLQHMFSWRNKKNNVDTPSYL